MVKRVLQDMADINNDDFCRLLQKFNDSFPKLFLDQPNGLILNKKVDNVYDDPRLETYLNYVSRTGKTIFEWSLVKNLFEFKIRTVISEMLFRCPYDEKSPAPNVEQVKSSIFAERILIAFRFFDGAPFTIQRLAELLVEPSKHYKKANKFLRALDKNLLIVATVAPDGTRPSLAASKEAEVDSETISTNISESPNKRARLPIDDVVQNGTDHHLEPIESMDVSESMNALTTTNSHSNAADNLPTTTSMEDESATVPTSTEYVELASDHHNNQDDEQSINQEIAQLFWNTESDCSSSDKIALETTNHEENDNQRMEVSREEIQEATSVAIISSSSVMSDGHENDNVAEAVNYTEVTSTALSSTSTVDSVKMTLDDALAEDDTY